MSIFGAPGSPAPMKLNYFPLTAKGFGVSLVLEDSGLKWQPNDFGGQGLKTLKEAFPVWGEKKAETFPFHQMPVLYTGDQCIGQCTAICQFIGFKGNTLGSTDRDYAISGMLLHQADEVYDAMYKDLPAIVDMVHSYDHKTKEAYDALFSTKIPGLLAPLEALVEHESGFTTTGSTPGELYLWSFLYQLMTCEAKTLNAYPKMLAWYQRTAERPSVQKVLRGEGPIGIMEPMFMSWEATQSPDAPYIRL